MNYFYIYIACGVLLVTVLAMNVSRVRMREQIGNGDGGNPDLQRAIRAHMNTLEHVLPFGFIVFVLAKLAFNGWILAFFTVGFLVARVLHAFSMLGKKFRLRQVSAGFTYLFEVAGSLLILWSLRVLV